MKTEERKKRDQLIIEEFKKTGKCSEVGRKFRLTGERVRQIVGEENNLVSKTIRVKETQEFLTKRKNTLGIETFLTTNESYKIKAHLGVKYKDIKEENLKKTILDLYKKDKSRKRIAATLGICYRTVSKYLDLHKQAPGCFRKEKLNERDKEIYTYWVKTKNILSNSKRNYFLKENSPKTNVWNYFERV